MSDKPASKSKQSFTRKSSELKKQPEVIGKGMHYAQHKSRNFRVSKKARNI